MVLTDIEADLPRHRLRLGWSMTMLGLVGRLVVLSGHSWGE
jgi:hypothetical protein